MLRALFLTLIPAFIFGCAEDKSSPPQPADPSALAQARVQSLKTEIKAAASRAEMEPLVRELEELGADSEVSAAMVRGSWRQVWSDFPMGERRGLLRDHIYQVVLDDEILWNIGFVERGPLRRVELLRAHYTVTPEALTYTYMRALFLPQWLPPGSHLMELATRAQSGAYDVNAIVYDHGENPLGLRIVLNHIFVDEEFRVSRLMSEDGLHEYLFVFERVERIQ